MFGSDCIVAVFVAPFGLASFSVVTNHVNQSSQVTELPDLVQDLNPATTVTTSATGDASGNTGQLSLVNPHGSFVAFGVTLDRSAEAKLTASNLYGYPAVWTQMRADTGSGHQRISVSTSSQGALAAAVTLPAIPALGPGDGADPATLAYSAGTLTVAPVVGAGFHQFQMRDNSGNSVATITSRNSSVALPSWLRSQLSGQSLTVAVMVGDTNMTFAASTLAEAFGSSGAVRGTAISMVEPGSPPSDDLTF